MIRLIFLFIVLGAGLFVGTQFSGQQGYVLISVANMTIEMSVTTLVLIVVGLLAILFGLEYLIKKVLRTSSLTWGWFHVRKLRHSRRNTNDGIIKLLEGNWKEAEKKLTRWASHHDKSLICYLLSAEACHQQNNKKQRDHYLALAAQQQDAQLVVELHQAKYQVADGMMNDAAETLVRLHSQYPNNPLILERLKVVFIETKAWSSLLTLLPMLLKNDRIDSAEFEQLTLQAQKALLEEIGVQNGHQGLVNHWNLLPKKMQQHPELIGCFLEQLLLFKADAEVYTVLRKLIKKQPSSRWLSLLARADIADTTSVISQLKGLVRDHDDNADLHSTLGQFYLRDQQWSAAQSHLERALEIRACIYDYAYLADVLEQQELDISAMEASRKVRELVEILAKDKDAQTIAVCVEKKLNTLAETEKIVESI